jgi:hypothetical protein
MNAVRFHVIVGDDRSLVLPDGIELKPGPAEVIVLQPSEKSQQAEEAGAESLAKRLARKARELDLHGLPDDLAQNHDHYLHGLPKGIDGK